MLLKWRRAGRRVAARFTGGVRAAVLSLFLSLLITGCGGSHVSGHDSPEDTDSADLWEADSIAYLYWANPGSPYRDEGRYIQFLDSLLALDELPEGLRERAEHRKRMASLNSPGTIAADFRFLERDGRESRLHSLDSPLTLLIFYDPECPHCDDILRWLAEATPLNRAIDEKMLTVVAVYAEGKREVWDSTRNDMPRDWLVGYDLTGILDNQSYSLPAMPTPYLLDKDKRVILKDPAPDRLVDFISRHAR